MIIGYVRVSTTGQADQGISLEAQESKIRAWAQLHDHDAPRIYSDVLSGAKAKNRPGLKTALSACKRGDILVVYSLSRLARSTKDALAISERLDKSGVDLVSLSENISTTGATGKMIFRLLAVLAEFERDLISERTKAALAHKRSKNEKLGGYTPFGYNVTRNGHLTPNEDEQIALELIAELREQGLSYRAIGDALREKNIKSKRGESIWHPNTVKKIIDRMQLSPIGSRVTPETPVYQ